jgi:hypothetical protein
LINKVHTPPYNFFKIQLNVYVINTQSTSLKAQHISLLGKLKQHIISNTTKNVINITFEISGSHGKEDVNVGILGTNAVWYCGQTPHCSSLFCSGLST